MSVIPNSNQAISTAGTALWFILDKKQNAGAYSFIRKCIISEESNNAVKMSALRALETADSDAGYDLLIVVNNKTFRLYAHDRVFRIGHADLASYTSVASLFSIACGSNVEKAAICDYFDLMAAL